MTRSQKLFWSVLGIAIIGTTAAMLVATPAMFVGGSMYLDTAQRIKFWDTTGARADGGPDGYTGRYRYIATTEEAILGGGLTGSLQDASVNPLTLGGGLTGTTADATVTTINGQNVPWKASVRAVCPTNTTLSGSQTCDDVALAVGNRVLTIAQTTAHENRLWTVAAGAWTAATDMARDADLTAGSCVRVTGGTRWRWSEHCLQTNPPADGGFVLGTTALNWQPRSRVVDVTAFGAKGNGVTDDTAAKDLAVAACGTAPCRLYFPAGTYPLTTGIPVLYDRQNLGGDGEHTSKLVFDPAIDGLAAVQFGACDGTTAGPTQGSIHSIAIAAAHYGAGAHQMTGLALCDVKYLDVDHVAISNFYQTPVSTDAGNIDGTSVGLKISGRHYVEVEHTIVTGDLPLSIVANTVSGAGGITLDHSTIRGDYATVGSLTSPITIGAGVYIPNGIFTEIGLEGGAHAVSWDDSSCTGSASTDVVFNNIRWEQAATNGGAAMYINHCQYNLTVRNAQLPGGNGCLYLRGIHGGRFEQIFCNTLAADAGAGYSGVVVDVADSYRMVFDNFFQQPNTTWTTGAMVETWRHGALAQGAYVTRVFDDATDVANGASQIWLNKLDWLPGNMITIRPQQVAGTGADGGLTNLIAGGQGQAQTGDAGNTSGGQMQIAGGAPGTGGSGAVGTSGPIALGWMSGSTFTPLLYVGVTGGGLNYAQFTNPGTMAGTMWDLTGDIYQRIGGQMIMSPSVLTLAQNTGAGTNGPGYFGVSRNADTGANLLAAILHITGYTTANPIAVFTDPAYVAAGNTTLQLVACTANADGGTPICTLKQMQAAGNNTCGAAQCLTIAND
jgi:hypothetical protein